MERRPLERMPFVPLEDWHIEALNALFPQWELYHEENEDSAYPQFLPPLWDDMVEAAYRIEPAIPRWAFDKVEQVHTLDPDNTHLIKAPGLPPLRAMEGASVVVKPRHNPDGLAKDARRETWPLLCPDGAVIQYEFYGPHWSHDVLMHQGKVFGIISTRGHPDHDHFGEFLGWHVPPHRPHDRSLRNRRCPGNNRVKHLETALPKFTGVINIEEVGNNLIEAHMRPSVEHFPLYGDEVVHMIMRLMTTGAFPEAEPPLVTGGTLTTVTKNTMAIPATTVGDEEDSWRSMLVYRPSVG